MGRQVNTEAQGLFDAQFLKRLEYLSIFSQRARGGDMLAQRRGGQMGGGVEFAEYRDYLHGDDLRHVDWNVYARHGDLLLKRFHEERDLPVYLLLDVSESMAIGDPTKFDFGRQLAAGLAYIALSDFDRVGIVTFDGKVRSSLPMMRGKNQILRVLKFLESLQTSGQASDLEAAVAQFGQRVRHPGVAILISDLLDASDFSAGLDRLRYHRFETHVVQIQAQEELYPTAVGDIELEDAETGARRQVTITPQHVQRYRQRIGEFNAAVQRYCRQYAMTHVRALSDVPFDFVLTGMMRDAGAIR